jgi:hypothetical protein
MAIIKTIGKLAPGAYKQMIDHLTRKKIKNPFIKAKDIVVDKKPEVEQTEMFNRFNQANPRQDMAGGGMLVQPGFGGTRQGYAKDNVGGKVGAKEVKDFKTNINNWTKNWIKENINNYNIRESNKFINDLKKAWAKESKNKKYKVVGVDSAKGRVLTQNGFPAVSTNKAVNSFNIFGYEMPGGIKTENIGNAQRNLYSKIFFTNTLKNDAALRKKLNFYFDYMTADKRGTNASSLSKKVTNIMAKAGVTDPKELLDKDVMYLLSKDSGMGDKARYEFFVNNYGNKYINYRNKVDSMHGDYIKNVRILKDKFNINVKSQLTTENNALKKIFNVDDLPFELRYSGDHLFGVSQAAKSNNKKFAIQAVNNLVGMTREQNKILGLGEFEKTRKNLINKINTAKVGDKTKLLTELNNLMKGTYQDFFGKKQNYYDLDKGKVTISKDFVPLSQEERFANYFKQIDKTKEGRAAIKKQYGNLTNLVASLGGGDCGRGLKNQGGRVGLQDGTTSVDVCFRNATNRINSGFKNATPAEARNYTKLLNAVKGSAVIGRNLLKFGILPEALYVGADSLIRMGYGDTFKEAGLRAVDFFIPGDQMQEADKLKVQRTLGDAAATNVGRVFDYRNQIANIDSLEQQKQNFENLSGGGAFDYVGDLSQDVKNIDTRLNQAKNDLQNKFMVSEAETVAADRALEEAYDISKAKSPLARLKSFAQNIEAVQDDPFLSDIATPQKTQMDLNLNMFPTAIPTQTDFMKMTDTDIMNRRRDLINAGVTNLPSSRDLMSIRDAEIADREKRIDEFKAMPLMDAANQFGKEQVFGTQGTFFGEPIIKTQPRVRNTSQDIDPFQAAGGGIAKLAGDRSGPPPESGPNSQGLQGLMKRVRNL